MYLGLGPGTSGVKAVLNDDQFGSVGVAHAPSTVSRPNLGRSEQSPDDWAGRSGPRSDAHGPTAGHDLPSGRHRTNKRPIIFNDGRTP